MPCEFCAVPALTQVPNSKTDEEAVTGLLQLAHDCSAAYGTAAEKANDAELKKALQKFAKQADSHIDQWRGMSFFCLCLASFDYALQPIPPLLTYCL